MLARHSPPTCMQDGTLLAAVDLGSNSFRLEIGRYEHAHIRRVQYLKETVRQGGGLDEERNLTAEAIDNGCACLARFGERLGGFSAAQVRAVATQTVREARNRGVFLARAEQVLGFPIEVISGREEARLIYQGVSRLLPQSDERRLVVDIGGRSTELILGQHFEADCRESYRVGSVSWSARYFADGQFRESASERAEIAALAVLDEAVTEFRRERWDVAYGSSGTIGAVSDILTAAGWPAGTIPRDGLDWLHRQLLQARSADRLRLAGLKEDRRPVIGGGVAVLRAVFRLLEIDRMVPAAGALRHGVLYDMLDREHSGTDVRSATVERLVARFQADPAQGARVGRVACHFFRQLHGSDTGSAADPERTLVWAARLHEIGNVISHSDAHKHGAYILDNADASGFSQPELHRLSLLVLGHRGKLRKLDIDFADTLFIHQLLSLRLAVILCHARRDPELTGLQLRRGGRGVRLAVPSGWPAAWPQSAHLLREECVAWQKTPWSLAVD